jgi:hypothetical protein
MKVIFFNLPTESYEDYLSQYGTIKHIEIIDSYDTHTYVGVDIDKEYEFTEPILELENDVKVIKWFESDYNVYLTTHKLELFRDKLMKSCHLTEMISLEKIKSLLDEFIIRQYISNQYSLIEFAYEYIGVLIPEYYHDKESIPSLYMMFEPFELFDYVDNIIKNGKHISIKQHSIMMELPRNVLKTFYGLPTKISQVFRSLFPNTWSQAYFNFMTNIIIHPTNDDKMIVIVLFRYYDGYTNHPNTHTMLDNIKTVQFLKDHSTTLSLVKDYTLNVPFPIIFGMSNEFKVEDDNMSVKVTCYNADLEFSDNIELVYPEDCKIPGDDTFGYLDNKNAFDPHQYHYVLRRLTRVLYDYDYIPYQCIMSEYDLPEEVMYFKI